MLRLEQMNRALAPLRGNSPANTVAIRRMLNAHVKATATELGVQRSAFIITQATIARLAANPHFAKVGYPEREPRHHFFSLPGVA